LKKFSDARGVTFPLLADEGSKTIDAYGIRNKEVKAGTKQDGVPYPGTFVLDREGIVRVKLFLEGVAERISSDETIEAAKAVP